MAADSAASHLIDFIGFLAPQVGLEPTTLRLTAECSAIELLRSVVLQIILYKGSRVCRSRQKSEEDFRPPVMTVGTRPVTDRNDNDPCHRCGRLNSRSWPNVQDLPARPQ